MFLILFSALHMDLKLVWILVEKGCPYFSCNWQLSTDVELNWVPSVYSTRVFAHVAEIKLQVKQTMILFLGSSSTLTSIRRSLEVELRAKAKVLGELKILQSDLCCWKDLWNLMSEIPSSGYLAQSRNRVERVFLARKHCKLSDPINSWLIGLFESYTDKEQNDQRNKWAKTGSKVRKGQIFI